MSILISFKSSEADFEAHTAFFRAELLKWWSHSKLNFEWRSWSDPYRILITEILLRKTQAEKVSSLVGDVLKEIEPLEKLIQIDRLRLESLLLPFGMYKKKADELKKMAGAIQEKFGGRVPVTFNELTALPGVGSYIASAVLCFGYGVRKAVVDINVIRVYERIFLLKSSRARPRDDPEVWEFAEQMLPEEGWKEFNYAVIDFAKVICRAKKPKCWICPQAFICPSEEKQEAGLSCTEKPA